LRASRSTGITALAAPYHSPQRPRKTLPFTAGKAFVTLPEMASPRQSAGATPAGEVISSRENKWLKEFRLALRGGLAT